MFELAMAVSWTHMSIFVRYDVTKQGALERQLEAAFDQRFENDTLKLWKKKKWMPAFQANARIAEATFALGDGRCSFTLPAALEDAGPLREFLTSKKAKNLEVRGAAPADIVENRLREVEIASRKGGEVFSTSQSAALGKSEKSWEVSILFPRDETPPPYDLFAFDDALVGFNLHRRGPQLHVLASSFDPGSSIERTITNLPAPMASLTGPSLGPNGVMYAGGAFAFGGADYTAIHVSTDRGRTWKAEDSADLSPVLGATGIATTCWFEDTLWAANETGIARRLDGVWDRVDVPSNQLCTRVEAFHSYNFLIDRYNYHAGRLMVVDGSLYFLGSGIALWNGECFVTELEPPASRFDAGVFSLVATADGTLLAGGPLLWRKARGGTWTRMSDEALGIDPTKPKPGEGMWSGVAFPGLHVLGNHIVVVANKHEPWEQRHLLRISDDDGKTYRPIEFERPDGNLVTCSSVVDAKGGVVVAGFGGVVLRVTPPRSPVR